MSQSKAQVIMELTIEQEGKCYYCKTAFKNATGFEHVSLDHKKPSSRGGSDAKVNLALTCQKCNSEKGQLDEKEYSEVKRLVGEGKFTMKDAPEYVRYLGLKEKFANISLAP